MSKFTKDKFERAITTGAKVLGGDLDVDVVFIGNRAFTNGSTITIPSLPEDVELTLDQVNIARGYYHHEAAHIRYTDFDVYGKTVGDLRGNGEEQKAEMCNVVEDCFIEREWMKEFAGSHKMLSIIHRTIDQNSYSAFLDKDQDKFEWWDIGLCAIQWRDGQEKDYDPMFRDRCLDMLTPEQRHKLEGWYDLVRNVTCTADCMKVAQQIVDEMFEHDHSDTVSEHKSIEERMDNWENLTQEEKDKLVEDSMKAGDKAEADQKEANGKVYVPSLDLAKILQGDDGGSGRKPQQEMTYRPFTTQYDKIYDRNNWNEDDWYIAENVFGDTSDAEYQKVMKRHNSHVSVMQRKIQRAFGSHDLRGWQGGHETGRLDARMLTQAYQGNDKVYRIRTASQEVSTSVQMVIDGSGSMNYSKLQMCILASAAVCKTLEAIGGESEIIFMPGGDADIDPLPLQYAISKARESGVDSNFTRYRPITNMCVKGFEDRLSRCRSALGNIVNGSCGGTPLHEAIHQSYRRLLPRNTNRKIQLLITDGSPDSDRLCREAIDHVRSKDIEVVGIGIGADYIGDWCDRNVVVLDIDDFGTAVMDDFARMLLGERFNAKNERRKVA